MHTIALSTKTATW